MVLKVKFMPDLSQQHILGFKTILNGIKNAFFILEI